jgi:hypothetical protein
LESFPVVPPALTLFPEVPPLLPPLLSVPFGMVPLPLVMVVVLGLVVSIGFVDSMGVVMVAPVVPGRSLVLPLPVVSFPLPERQAVKRQQTMIKTTAIAVSFFIVLPPYLICKAIISPGKRNTLE